MRGLLGADPDTGQVAVGAPTCTRARSCACTRATPRRADRDLREALGAPHGGARRRAAGGRAAVHLQRPRARDVRRAPTTTPRRVDDELGGAPRPGFFAAGEIGPVGGETFLHGFTATVAVFGRVNARAAATVLLTGATGGLGHAIARALRGRGAQLVLTGRRTDVLEPLAAELGGRALAVDLADRDDVDRAARRGRRRRRAGRQRRRCPAAGRCSSSRVEQIDRALDVNLRAPIVLARHARRAMVARGSGPPRLHLLAVGQGRRRGGSASTAATKFGLRGFALGLREDLRGTGVGVSSSSRASSATPGCSPSPASKLPRLRRHEHARGGRRRRRRARSSTTAPRSTSPRSGCGSAPRCAALAPARSRARQAAPRAATTIAAAAGATGQRSQALSRPLSAGRRTRRAGGASPSPRSRARPARRPASTSSASSRAVGGAARGVACDADDDLVAVELLERDARARRASAS